MDSLLKDVRYGLRMLRKSPAFAVLVVLMLALGIGANSAVFGILNAYFLRALPFAQPEQLVHLWGTVPHREYGDQARVSVSNFLDWRQRARSFEQLGAYYYTMANVAADERPIQIQITRVTANLTSVLGVAPSLGRAFASGEDQPGRDKEVLLGHGYWQQHFNSEPQVLGRTVRLDGENYSVIGVMPESFVFPLKATQMWVPMSVTADESRRGEPGPLLVIGRLKPGVSRQTAQAEMDNITRGLAAEFAANKGTGANVVPLPSALLFFYDQLRLLFVGLLCATGFVLLIVCSNVGNLMVARAIERGREVAIRTALGATRARVVRQLITESALLALLGAAAGLVFANWITGLLDAHMPEDLYRAGNIAVDWRVLVFTVVTSLLTVCLFGLAPALLVSRPRLNEALKEGSRTGLSLKSRRVHNVLVVGEIALAMVLLAGAIVSVHTFMQQRNLNPGFNAAGVLTARVSLPRREYPDAARLTQFYNDVCARVQRLPSVEAVSTVDPLPMNFELATREFLPEGQMQDSYHRPEAATFTVSPDYFRAMQIPVLQGRAFSAQDRDGAPPVVMVNRLLAERTWAAQSAVGKALRVFDNKGTSRIATVIGIVADAKDFLMNQELRPQIYIPALQSPATRSFLVIRTSADPLASVAGVRSAVEAVDRNITVAEVRTMERVVTEALSPFMFSAGILGLLGSGALLLAAIGIYGVIAYSVRQRTHEIGVRMALGADEVEIVRMVLRQGMRLAGLGLAIGLAGSVALLQVARAALPGSIFDPVALVGAPVVLASVALLACVLPARRAMRVDPVVALRYE